MNTIKTLALLLTLSSTTLAAPLEVADTIPSEIMGYNLTVAAGSW